MTELLRSAIASPRSRYYDAVADTYLDLAYLEHNIIVCSMPTNEFPKILYRNSLSDLRKLLDVRHGSHWHIWEFRSEGAGYEDSEFYNRVSHFPFPDHNPPPFAMFPKVVASLHKFLSLSDENVAVLHCKAGKGRSGTVFCAYLVAQHQWSAQNAMAHFTAKRMKPGFGEGVSILSQRRYIRYVERWASDPNRDYRDLNVLIREVRVFNPAKGIEVRCRGFMERGNKIVTIYHFEDNDIIEEVNYPLKHEVSLEDAEHSNGSPVTATADQELANVAEDGGIVATEVATKSGLHRTGTYGSVQFQNFRKTSLDLKLTTGREVIFRPKADVLVDGDINITIEKKIYGPAGISFLSSTAYTWFNAFFEGNHDTGGTYKALWESMDGFKGTKKRGNRLFDGIEVDWEIVPFSNDVSQMY